MDILVCDAYDMHCRESTSLVTCTTFLRSVNMLSCTR